MLTERVTLFWLAKNQGAQLSIPLAYPKSKCRCCTNDQSIVCQNCVIKLQINLATRLDGHLTSP